MNSSSIKFIDKLIEMTQHNELTWEIIPPITRMNSSFMQVNSIYETRCEGMIIWVYQRDYKYYYDESDFSWEKDVVIEIINPDTKNVIKELNLNNATELLNAINYKSLNPFYFDIFMG